MSDISLSFEWWEWLLAGLIIGWPGFVIAGLAGAALWRKHRILGGALSAIAGDLAWAAAVILLK